MGVGCNYIDRSNHEICKVGIHHAENRNPIFEALSQRMLHIYLGKTLRALDDDKTSH